VRQGEIWTGREEKWRKEGAERLKEDTGGITNRGNQIPPHVKCEFEEVR